MTGYRNGYIELESPREAFYPGQVVLGSVGFVLDQPLTLSVLYINFLGEARVEWNETESESYNGQTRYKKIAYVGREEYFNFTQLLAGGNAPLNLPPGTHTYKFSYQIPPGVPSSFRGTRGNVTYGAKATLELRGQTELKEEISKTFDVIAPFDLNQGSPRLKEPLDLQFEEVYNCGCFCSSDPVTIRIRLPVSGWCPGQVIPVALEVENSSSVEIRKMIFQILTREKYHTQRPVSAYEPPVRVLSSIKTGPVLSGTKRNLTVHVPVPDLIAPNLENCGIIDVGYFFKAIIKLSGCNDDLEDEEEICLGLIPLNETLDGDYLHPLSQNLPIGPIPDIPAVNMEEQNRQFEAHQQSAYPNGPPHFPNTQSGYPFPNDENVQSSYHVEVRQMHFSSSDPSKNYNIGFKMSSAPGSEHPTVFTNFQGQNRGSSPFPNQELRIHLPQPNVNVNVPTAPPPSS